MAGYPWSAGDQLNAADLNAISARLATFTYGETLAVTNAVCYGLYQSDGGVLYDTSATGTVTASGGVGTITNPITVGSNSNRIVIAIVASTTSTAPTATWNGSAMTVMDRQQQSSGGSWMHTFYIIAPTTGAHNLVFSSLSATETVRYFVYSYYNASQSAQPDNHAIAQGTTSVSASITPTVPGTLVFGGVWDQDGTFSSVTGVPNHSQTPSSYAFGDNGQIAPATSQTITGTDSTSGHRIIATIISIAPFTAASYRVLKASSALNNYRAQCFIGFPLTAGVAGDVKNVIIGGVVTGLSGLTPLAQYYLNDTNGTIGTTPGTVTRKVGIALDSATLLLTNEW